MKVALETQRKQLRFRSWHRGTRELDLILGPFADAHLFGMSRDQLDCYDILLGTSDSEIYNWIRNDKQLPTTVDPDLAKLIRSFINRALHTEKTR